MNPYPEEFKKKLIKQASFYGTAKTARFNHISVQSLVNWLNQRGLSFKRKAPVLSCVICGNMFKHSKNAHRICCSWKCKRIYNADIRKCVFCGKVKAVDLHHITPYKYFNGEWKRANDKFNLAELCQKCHVLAENHVRKIFKIIEYVEAI